MSFLIHTPPLRYGFAAVILFTLGYSSLHIVPMIQRDLRLLQDLYAVDEKGISLEGELQHEAQESRRRFLRILLAGKNAEEAAGETRAMRSYDSQVGVTEAQIGQLGSVPQQDLRNFRQAWDRYLALRDRILEKAATGNPEDVRAIDADLGKGAFQSVVDAIRRGEQEFETRSAAHVKDVSATLQRTLIELLLLIVVKTLVLFLLIWMDWKRVATERKLVRATRELKASEERFRQAYESAAVGMAMIGLDGRIVTANRKEEEILGYEPGGLCGVHWADLMAPEFRDGTLQNLAELPNSHDSSYRAERRVIRKDGSPAWVRNSVTFLKPEGEEGHYFSISEEITLQKQANDRLAFLANFDPVTNLPNRHHFEHLLREALQAISGTMNCVALLYAEIDSFDFLKGTFGPNVADEVLGELGSTLASWQREGEVVGKLDDHVFGVLVKAAPFDEATLQRGSELREIFHRFGETGVHRIPLSASIGIAYSSEGAAGLSRPRNSDGGSEADTLLKYARAAMLEARSRGGDCTYVADPALEERAAQRHRIESALLKGLREDEFRVVFQPQFEVQTGNLVRFEALCRWTSKELGTIPPDRFIPIAEQTGLISEMGRRILLDALRQASQWSESGRRIGVAVNISPLQFMRPDFTNTIAEVLAQTGFPAALLELEITEGIFIRDLNVAVARIRELQRLGLSIALDDFGTGYSSLSYLQRMPIDAVKLDRSFVSDLTTESATVSMVRSVLEMARALHLRVVTEGVETEEQLEILRELGCDEAQGYLLGRPESAEMALRRVLGSTVSVLA